MTARAQARRTGQLRLLCSLWLLWPLVATAHAHLEQSQPAEGAILAAAPADSLDALTQGDGQGYRDRVYGYYKAERYW